MKTVHVITGLSTGGAEMMLFKLLSVVDRAAFNSEVISLTDIGPLGRRIQGIDISVRGLGMRRGVPNPLAVLRLARWLRQTKPDIIQTWMYHADLIGAIAAKLACDIPVAWGVRHSNLDSQGSKRATIWTARFCAVFSRWMPVYIVCCSEASRQVHTALGYAANKIKVIPNGFDLTVFRPDPGSRISVCKELGISESSLLIGLVARFDAQKDHGNFLKAAALLHTGAPNAHFLLCGKGITWQNRELSRCIDDSGISEHCHLLGPREDMPRLMAALDIAASSSFGEGFPNVIGEAMACGVPCVVTDVGDSALLVGDSGVVVPARDPVALADAWQKLIDMGADARRRMGEAARKRIGDKFSLSAIAGRYEKLYREMSLQCAG